jgi:hypothetical protein
MIFAGNAGQECPPAFFPGEELLAGQKVITPVKP